MHGRIYPQVWKNAYEGELAKLASEEQTIHIMHQIDDPSIMKLVAGVLTPDESIKQIKRSDDEKRKQA